MRVAKSAPLTYGELKRLEVNEFFRLLITHVEQQKQDKNSRNGK